MPPKSKNKDAEAAEQKDITIVITEETPTGDRHYRLRSDELGPGDDLVSRQQTGFPVGHFLETFSSDSMVVVIWMARRKTGEANLSFQDVLKNYPSYASFKRLNAEIETDDGEVENPLADGE